MDSYRFGLEFITGGFKPHLYLSWCYVLKGHLSTLCHELGHAVFCANSIVHYETTREYIYAKLKRKKFSSQIIAHTSPIVEGISAYLARNSPSYLQTEQVLTNELTGRGMARNLLFTNIKVDWLINELDIIYDILKDKNLLHLEENERKNSIAMTIGKSLLDVIQPSYMEVIQIIKNNVQQIKGCQNEFELTRAIYSSLFANKVLLYKIPSWHLDVYEGMQAFYYAVKISDLRKNYYFITQTLFSFLNVLCVGSIYPVMFFHPECGECSIGLFLNEKALSDLKSNVDASLTKYKCHFYQILSNFFKQMISHSNNYWRLTTKTQTGTRILRNASLMNQMPIIIQMFTELFRTFEEIRCLWANKTDCPICQSILDRMSNESLKLDLNLAQTNATSINKIFDEIFENCSIEFGKFLRTEKTLIEKINMPSLKKYFGTINFKRLGF